LLKPDKFSGLQNTLPVNYNCKINRRFPLNIILSKNLKSKNNHKEHFKAFFTENCVRVFCRHND
jgi:hypothetical protein